MKKKTASKAKKSVDILGVLRAMQPGRVLILDPQENQPAHEGILIAESTCEITFDSEQKLLACIEALRESDTALRMRPESLKLWEWNKTYREGMKIVFGVLWYDRAFFEARKNSYKNANHASYYKRFGATARNFKVKHKLLVTGLGA